MDGKVYYSKKGFFIGLIVWGPFFYMIFFAINNHKWLILLIGLIVCVFIGIIWFDTKYIVTQQFLIIKIGGSSHKYPINELKKIRKTNTFLAAAANSLDRIALDFGKHGELVISPKNRKEFLEDLISLNGNIVLDDTLKFIN